MDVSASSGDSDGQEVWCAAVHGVTKSWTQLSNQITTIRCLGREIWEAFGTKMSVMEKKNRTCLRVRDCSRGRNSLNDSSEG